MFSKLKAWPRSAGARTIGCLIGAMGDAPQAVRPADIAVWFRHGRMAGLPIER
ncbi:hypothetical protein [Paludisphaera soli]|uniref:hypothetical protein n=1 Tax=Paludisphaera soli TaxID=2712865 RepID=UPI0013EAE88A|nr:hypothetical protein [Paludisphaera soli]